MGQCLELRVSRCAQADVAVPQARQYAEAGEEATGDLDALVVRVHVTDQGQLERARGDVLGQGSNSGVPFFEQRFYYQPIWLGERQVVAFLCPS